MFIVVDEFGFAWGDLVETLEEAKQQLHDIQKDAKAHGFDYDGFEIERRS